MEKVRVTYKNTDGEELVMGRFAPFYMLSFSGFGTPETTITTQNLFGVDGAQKVARQISVREMEIILLIKGESFDELQDLKQRVIKVLNPALSGTIIYEVLDKIFEIDVEIIKGVDEGENNTSLTQKGSLQFKALDPYWRDRSEYNKLIPLSQVENKFKFPLQITEDYKFAEMKPGEIITIDNTGDAAVGAIFTLNFTKSVKNPRIYNVRTQEYFGFNHVFGAGDVVTINTIRNQKQVLYKENGEDAINAMSMRTPGSSFLILNKGQTYLQIQADAGLEGIIANLDYSPLVLGV